MAIDDLLDEHEQSVRLQQWLRKNGGSILLGLLLGLGLLGALNWYQGHRARQGMAAADGYTAAVEAINAGSADAAAKVDVIGTPAYKALAMLHLARSQVTAGKSADAIATLKKIETKDTELRELTDVRLARLYTETGKAKEAIALLAQRKTPDALEALGDAYAADQQLEPARKSYTNALTHMDAASASRQVVELKLTQVGGTPVVKAEAP